MASFFQIINGKCKQILVRKSVYFRKTKIVNSFTLRKLIIFNVKWPETDQTINLKLFLWLHKVFYLIKILNLIGNMQIIDKAGKFN